jgi:hypothetical protein
MNKITHSIFLIFATFLILSSTNVDAQYLNTNSNKIPLGFMSSQYWQNNYSEENDSLFVDASHWYLRVPHKFGIGLLGGALGFGAGLGFGYLFRIPPAYYLLPPIGYLIGSSIGVSIVSKNYGKSVTYTLIFLGGTVSFVGVYAIGEKIRKNSKNTSIIPQLIGAVFLSLAAEIFISEIDDSSFEYDKEWDEYIYNETDKLVFHKYVKSTQVFNFELFRIQL